MLIEPADPCALLIGTLPGGSRVSGHSHHDAAFNVTVAQTVQDGVDVVQAVLGADGADLALARKLQRFLQCSPWPQAVCSHGTPTRSPSGMFFTPAPTAAT